MFNLLRRLFAPHNERTINGPVHFSPDYWAFTTSYDEVINASSLVTKVEQAHPCAGALAERLLDQLRTQLAAERLGVETAVTLAAERIAPAVGKDTLSVTLLMDHSGSMRGDRIQITVQLAEATAQMAYKLRLPFEILGFTTVSWKGGEPRVAWINRKRPAGPGRLCALRHIVYSAFDSPFQHFVANLHAMLLPDVLKENVDGEALLWAAGRAREAKTGRHLIVVVSDGVPVDDSTLHENGNDYILDHLHTVVRELGSDPTIQLCGVGLDHDVAGIYPAATSLRFFGEVERVFVPFLTEQIAGASLRSPRLGGTAP